MVQLRNPLTWTVALALGLAAGCSREDVTHYQIPKEQPPAPAPMAAGMAPGMPAGMPPGMPPAGRPKGPGLRWTLPAGWTDAGGGPMRVATFKLPVSGEVDASVVTLPGPAGGELANVNRWRGQIGLSPLDEPSLAGARKVVHTKAGAVNVYDFSNDATPRHRVIAALTEVGGDTWFVKMTGDARAVAAARADFMKLLASLRVE